MSVYGKTDEEHRVVMSDYDEIKRILDYWRDHELLSENERNEFEKAAKTMMDTLASIDTYEVSMMGHGAYHDYCGDCHDCCGGCNL